MFLVNEKTEVGCKICLKRFLYSLTNNTSAGLLCEQALVPEFY